jgi:hypothetical protein
MVGIADMRPQSEAYSIANPPGSSLLSVLNSSRRYQNVQGPED